MGQFYQWFLSTESSEPKISLFAMQAMQYLFVNLYDQNQVGILNNHFVEILNFCINKILSMDYI